MAARDPELNARYAAAHARALDALGETLRGLFAALGTEPRLPIELLALIAFALDTGSFLEDAVSPGGFPTSDSGRPLLHARWPPGGPRRGASAMTELDQFRGRFQAALFGSLAEHVERLTWDHARVEAFQRERLRTLLAVAIERSPFHTRRLTAIDQATFELADLTRLPVMTKAELMCQFDDVSADRRLSLAAADEAISATGTEPRPVGGELIVLASGGSTGTRGVFAFDADSFAEYAATLLRPAVARRSGAALAASGPTVIVAAGSAIHATGAGPALLEGSPVAFTRAARHPAARRHRGQAQRTATRRPVRLSEHPRRAPS